METADELSIRNLIARVAWLSDHWESTDEYVANFTEDGTWQIVDRTEVYAGHAGLARRLIEMREQGICGPGIAARHCITSLEVIPVPGCEDRATARSIALMIASQGEQCGVSVFGEYHDHVQKLKGIWRIQSRRIVIP